MILNYLNNKKNQSNNFPENTIEKLKLDGKKLVGLTKKE
jgi:hypothetical protein